MSFFTHVRDVMDCRPPMNFGFCLHMPQTLVKLMAFPVASIPNAASGGKWSTQRKPTATQEEQKSLLTQPELVLLPIYATHPYYIYCKLTLILCQVTEMFLCF